MNLRKSGPPSVTVNLLKPPSCTALLMGLVAAENRFLSASPLSFDIRGINAFTCDRNIKEVSVNYTVKMKNWRKRSLSDAANPGRILSCTI